jgi:hypothetical protein
VAAELTTTFASSYTREVSLAGMLNPHGSTNTSSERLERSYS